MNSLLKGRTNRATYWLLLGIVTAIFAALILSGAKPPAIGELVLIFLCVPRLHDLGWSGWWAAGIIALEVLVLVGAGLALSGDDLLVVAGIYAFGIAGFLIFLGLIPGQPMSNRFGERPAPGISFGRKPADPDTVF
jgi:uncharacterized membrane protein YhaH (DUF805 family)